MKCGTQNEWMTSFETSLRRTVRSDREHELGGRSPATPVTTIPRRRVAELPLPLEADDLDGEGRVGIEAGDALLGADAEAEQHADEHERHRRVEHLEGDVVLALARRPIVVVAAPAVADHDEDDQAVDQEADHGGDHTKMRHRRVASCALAGHRRRGTRDCPQPPSSSAEGQRERDAAQQGLTPRRSCQGPRRACWSWRRASRSLWCIHCTARRRPRTARTARRATHRMPAPVRWSVRSDAAHHGAARRCRRRRR